MWIGRGVMKDRCSQIASVSSCELVCLVRGRNYAINRPVPS